MEFIKPIIWKAGVLDFFFFLPVSNSGSAIIKPYGLWQGRASQVVIFLYFWHGTCFNKKVAPVLAVTECYRCDKNSRGVWKSERERESKKSEKRICLWHLWDIDRAVRRASGRVPQSKCSLSLSVSCSVKINPTEEHTPKEAGASFQWKAMSAKLNVTETAIAPVGKD